MYHFMRWRGSSQGNYGLQVKLWHVYTAITEHSYKKLQLQGRYKQELKSAKKEGTVFNWVILTDIMEEVA